MADRRRPVEPDRAVRAARRGGRRPVRRRGRVARQGVRLRAQTPRRPTVHAAGVAVARDRSRRGTVVRAVARRRPAVTRRLETPRPVPTGPTGELSGDARRPTAETDWRRVLPGAVAEKHFDVTGGGEDTGAFQMYVYIFFRRVHTSSNGFRKKNLPSVLLSLYLNRIF